MDLTDFYHLLSMFRYFFPYKHWGFLLPCWIPFVGNRLDFLVSTRIHGRFSILLPRFPMFYKEKVMKRDAGVAETFAKMVMCTQAQGCKEMGDFNSFQNLSCFFNHKFLGGTLDWGSESDQLQATLGQTCSSTRWTMVPTSWASLGAAGRQSFTQCGLLMLG